MRGSKLMEVSFWILLILEIHLLEIGCSVNPGCQCLIYSSTFGKDKGIFNSPDFPKPYPPDLDCLLYTFIASSDQIIEINFLNFDIRKTELGCTQGDYLKLFSHLEKGEVNEYTQWTSLYCGGLADIPTSLYSSGPGLVMEFHTEPFTAGASGFLGTFKFIDKRLFQTDGQKLPGTMCDYQFQDSSYPSRSNQGKFYSPRYPSDYPKNIRCFYSFRARAKERIRLVFEQVALEKGDLSCLNRADIVRVHDGKGSYDPVIDILCNEATEHEVISTGSELFVEFISNSEFPGQGFRAIFYFIPIDDRIIEDGSRFLYPVVQGASLSGSRSMCDTVYLSDNVKNGTLTSPSYPSPYPAKSTCRYEFQGRGKERVQIIFHEFNLYHPKDDAKQCENQDTLLVYVHMEGRWEKLEHLCANSLPKPIMSNGPRLKLEFQGHTASRHSRGFKATFSFTNNYGIRTGTQLPDYPCAFVFNSNESRSGYFNSPNYPGYYPRDTECHYYFHGLPGERIHLHFNYFDVEGVLPCEANSASDYVEFSNYMTRDRKYDRHCGQLKEFDVASDRKFFRVAFKSNDRLDGTGFNATYRFLSEIETFTIKTIHVLSSDSSGIFTNLSLLMPLFIQSLWF